MTPAPDLRARSLPGQIRCILLDVEGTVGDIAFVHDVLFPYARERIADFVSRNSASAEVGRIVADAARLTGTGSTDEAPVVQALLAWSDANAKVGPLKALQGLIWREGYESGALRSHVYDDVPPAIASFRDRGLRVAIYSSGSALAQQLYFKHTVAGDLTPLLAAYFDTEIGAKGDASSYERIARSLEVQPEGVCFFSDAKLEVEAARAAGMQAVRVDRTLREHECHLDSDRAQGGPQRPVWGGIADVEARALGTRS